MLTLSNSAKKIAGSPLDTVAECGKSVYFGVAICSPATLTTSVHDEKDSPASLNASHVYTPEMFLIFCLMIVKFAFKNL